MTDELSVALGVLSIVVLLGLPGLAAGIMVGLWYTLPNFAVEFAGYATTLTVLAVACVISLIRFRKKMTPGVMRFFAPFLVFVATILAREWLGADERTSWQAIGVAVLVGLLFAIVGSFRPNTSWMIWGFALANSVFAIGEIVRVASGGALHASYAAFNANPIFSAQFLGIAFFGILALWNAHRARALFALPMLALLGGTLFLTLSRGPIIAFVLAFVFWILFNKPTANHTHFVRKQLVLIASSVVALFAFLYLQNARSSSGDELSAEVRQDHWETSWATIWSNFLWGSGTDALFTGTPAESPSPVAYPHNILLETWGTYGLLSLLALAVGLVLLFRRLNGSGRACLLFIVICFCVSGTLTISIGFWTGIAMSIIIAGLAPRSLSGTSAVAPTRTARFVLD